MRRSHGIMVAALAATAALSGPVQAAGVTAGVTGGTLGIGPEIGVRLSETIGIRGNAAFLGVSHGFDSDDVDYDGHARLRSAGLMIDSYPFENGFRISAGARYNRNRARVVATPTADTQIGFTTYTPAQIGTITGRGTVRKFAPALTLGYSGGRDRGFMFSAEAGGLFQGRVRVSRFVNNGIFASNATFLNNLEVERQDLQDDADNYKVYPILQLGVGWRF